MFLVSFVREPRGILTPQPGMEPAPHALEHTTKDIKKELQDVLEAETHHSQDPHSQVGDVKIRQ